MNIINRNYTPVSGSSVQVLSPQSETAVQPAGLKPAHNSNLIDFGSLQQTSAPGNLRAGAHAHEASTYSSRPQGADGELTLNKLVEAIRSFINELLTLLRGNQREQPDSAPQPQSETPTHRTQPSPTSLMSSPESPPTSPGTGTAAAQKPFVVRNDPSTQTPAVSPKTTTPPTTVEPTGTTDHKALNPAQDAKTPVINNPVSLKTKPETKPETTNRTNPEAEKPTKPATRTPVGQGTGADMSGMVGFAKAAKTTGGNGGEVVTVNTVEELQKSMADDTARTVKLGADLSADSKVTVKFGANKTLLGTDKGNALHNIYLASDKTASNDIFQNLNFTHDSRYRENGDMQMFISSGQRYWIDHNTFTGTKDQNPKGLDKLLYVGGTADNVSLTNSKFQNNEYGVILGQPDDSAAAKAEYKGYPRMTIANNSFDNLDVRAPGLMRHGYFDVFNNNISNFHLGFTATGDATILSQANNFDKGVDVGNKPSTQGVLDDYGDAHFKDIGSNVSFKQKSAVTVWTPPYQRDVKTAEAAKAYDLANAGANP
ncbi:MULTISPECIES: type III helper protein HopAK1 [Pseudomonas syringae group]|nr:type III helper protein HopAK1 [Pseudomonas syringae group genomosp. 3]